jgi:hypothetical protein
MNTQQLQKATLKELVDFYIQRKSGIPNLLMEDLLQDKFDLFMDFDIAVENLLNANLDEDEFDYDEMVRQEIERLNDNLNS